MAVDRVLWCRSSHQEAARFETDRLLHETEKRQRRKEREMSPVSSQDPRPTLGRRHPRFEGPLMMMIWTPLNRICDRLDQSRKQFYEGTNQQLHIEMPEIRCPGYPKCKRHFKYIGGLKGHAFACQFAAKYFLVRPPSHPEYRLGSKVAEVVVFSENHEIGNDRICRQNITVFTPESVMNRRFL
ncbi:hypothetical protein LSAT2_029432 [Lamellibrachia satsuma]|nr:hypothetical protein LSAT2_029432 [Lamellibrachia satsuma]